MELSKQWKFFLNEQLTSGQKLLQSWLYSKELSFPTMFITVVLIVFAVEYVIVLMKTTQYQ
jgi:hypothetical protein